MSAARIVGRREAQSRAEQEEASCGCRQQGRRLREPGRRPSRERRAGGPTGEDGSVRHLRFLFSPFHLHRVAADGTMDLAGLLLDEEGTFSLTGFQDFTVRATVRLSLAPPSPPGWESGFGVLPSGPERKGSSLICHSQDWVAVESNAYSRPGPLGPRGKPLGCRKEWTIRLESIWFLVFSWEPSVMTGRLFSPS